MLIMEKKPYEIFLVLHKNATIERDNCMNNSGDYAGNFWASLYTSNPSKIYSMIQDPNLVVKDPILARSARRAA